MPQGVAHCELLYHNPNTSLIWINFELGFTLCILCTEKKFNLSESILLDLQKFYYLGFLLVFFLERNIALIIQFYKDSDDEKYWL